MSSIEGFRPDRMDRNWMDRDDTAPSMLDPEVVSQKIRFSEEVRLATQELIHSAGRVSVHA